ncbi:hypothetical protein ALQ33_102175 [Pseudomonas syringae pv. philadelphi]|uniref:Uncharacterized protein n=1 Tax=Pseudomonas syringae pv. philadelphi TaxID=251706 RepID=A0A3M3ZDS5_9PSED|nr:hypothetical protein ALQ33_102175 [Pseudomonas syringae pv. philadelphi]
MDGLPVNQRKAFSGTLIQVMTVAPDVLRQMEQWQCAMSRSGASN